jgi:hypothetical protein
MAEQSENEASKSGQNVETPETESSGGSTGETGGYRESEEHVPDPTALTGTLETSGTGGGVHERLTGTTRIFGDVEDVAQRIETLINERTQSLKDEVRGLLLQQEGAAQAAQIPQQSVEEHGLPTHTGNIIRPGDDTGAASDAPRSANVAGSPDDVSEGLTRVEEPAQDSYSQTTIAGARDPQEPVEKAKRVESEGATEEPKESGDKSDFEKAADEHEARLDEMMSAPKAPAKKSTSSRRGSTKK